MKKPNVPQETSLHMMRYLIGDINYAGKIQKDQDLLVLKTIIDDLFNPTLSFCPYAHSDLNHSHYGFPGEPSEN